MKTRDGLSFLFAASFLALAAAAARAEHPPGSPPSPALIGQLRAGGLVLYLRHAMTERKPDAEPPDLDACPTQRNLSDAGREAARTIGREMKRLGIYVGEVRASPFCRTRETAYLAFGAAASDPGLLSGGNPKDPAEQARLPGLARLLSKLPGAGANTVLVGHSGLLDNLAKLHLDEAEMAVFRPLGRGRYVFIARIRAEHWQAAAAPR